MRVLQLLSIVLSFALTAFAGVAAPGRHLKSSSPKSIKALQESGVIIKNFLISDIYTYALSNASNSTLNTTISFIFTDLNSNTSTICTDSWTQTNSTSTAPFSYVACNPTDIEEFFQWHFVSYSSLANFQIMFAHLFADPVDYPPPFDVVEYFSAPANFTLGCSDATGLGGCTLPAAQSPVHAFVDGISA